MINQIKGLSRGSADHQVLSQKFQSQICNQKQKMVWCCDGGEPNSDLSGKSTGWALKNGPPIVLE